MSARFGWTRSVPIGLLLGAVAALGGWEALSPAYGAGEGAARCGPVPIARPSGLCRGPAMIGPGIPAELVRDPGTLDTWTGSRMTDCFAWESFAALNWPAAAVCRGTPGRGPEAASDWTSNRVWETYKEPYELFQATDTSWDPADVGFDDAAPTGGACGEVASGKKVLRHGAKFPVAAQLVTEDSQAFLPTAVLVDQDGNNVWYEILMNRDVFDYIRDAGMARTGAYSFGGPLGDLAAVDFPTAKNGASGAGTITIKAAWREMTDDDDLTRYFTQEAVTYDGTDCTDITVGLVGLHIARKVASSPKWIWATFEHEDNVPPAGSDGDGRDYNFFSLQCAIDAPTDCSQQVAIVDTDDICCPNLITYPSPDPADSINQVTRLIPIQASPSIDQRFRQAYAAAGSPFQYLTLVGAQWAKPKGVHRRPWKQEWGFGRGFHRSFHKRRHHDQHPVRNAAAYQRPCNPNGPWAVLPPQPGEACYEQIPEFLRNTSMETLFVQTDETGTQRVTDSCMNCHFAGGIDGSYLWLDAMLNPYELSSD